MSTDDGRGEIGLALVWSLNRREPWSAQATYEGRGPVRGPWAGTRAVGHKRAVGKKEGRGQVRRAVGKAEGRWRARRAVGHKRAVGHNRAAGKKEGCGQVRRAVGKKEGRGQAYRSVGHLGPASNERAAIKTEARIQLEARTKAR